MENAIVIKLTPTNQRSAGEEITATLRNAEQHNGKTLFTFDQSVDLRRWKDRVEHFIATTKNGKTALIARVMDFNDREKNPDAAPDLEEFPQVPPYAPDDKKTWFALSDVRAIEIREGDFSNDEGRDLLDLIGGRSSRAYVSYSE
ncbi:hypothetical protein KRX56_05355 [Dermabacteraceae bacterium TAE3-ERU27]|nr:hypothetical protein [Dermabacteraceae bacterium TAE3-ERU27]